MLKGSGEPNQGGGLEEVGAGRETWHRWCLGHQAWLVAGWFEPKPIPNESLILPRSSHVIIVVHPDFPISIMSIISPVVVINPFLRKNCLRKSREADDAVFQSITSKACSDVPELSDRRGWPIPQLESWTAKVNKEGCQKKLQGRVSAFNVYFQHLCIGWWSQLTAVGMAWKHPTTCCNAQQCPVISYFSQPQRARNISRHRHGKATGRI